MKRRDILAALAAFPFAGAALAQDQTVLTEVSKYLNQLTSVGGRFTQINGDGSRSAGRYWLRRPGRLRFEYDGGQAMVVADGVNIAVFDAKSNAPVQRYPIGTTPLRFLLAERIDLTRANLAQQTGSQGGFTSVVLRDPNAPRDGSMELKLRNSPPALSQWTVREKSGQTTTVVLETLEPVQGMDMMLFNIEALARSWPPR
ncbi:outer membrane lipoprotein carrier protein LolA [Rhodobacteraceae bacterium 2CG4]|uniref:Outer membrane lipoprotein carrier protein LolA n=1 Tax=Halovulum marinum TaxID=2662447 RepID=A0A6L5Z719_9RHOB|nr:outer membrane lipoprotein carrier protein LolA [Halovulum marinum]MSU92346.1 outer membrane lipoprotein carrier protein LolA [Halovulum marinum]